MKKLFQNIGPSALIAAAFIGPGTITVCSMAGIAFGYDLLWALLFSILATIVLQEMSARLGLVTGKDLAGLIRIYFTTPWKKILSLILVIVAIVLGNAAYEAGNITGAVLGFDAVFKLDKVSFFEMDLNILPILIGGIAIFILALGSYKKIENVLMLLVVLMSLSFVISALLIAPDWLGIAKGIFVPSFPENSLTSILAIVGTTVVPYNLFLHSAIVQEKWNSPNAIKYARWDIFIAVGLGGIVSMAVLISGAALYQEGIMTSDFSKFADSLAPLYGDYASYLLGFGFFAAGITSTITAALAAAYVLKSTLNWQGKSGKLYFKLVWIGIILSGVIFSSLGIQPLELIQTAQISNAILLPFAAIFLYIIVSNKKWMGKYKNNFWQSAFGFFILLFSLFLGFKSVLKFIS
ncbi:Nramp family divalent metal transporter [Psychroflexus planctonicus]|uniref:Manganese transporter n=1 Tax=Psychroflexus planctonicus TaxID=1526575 RepID=A0ABQ1SDQ2_9FLAO|nr:Nramp family divalent metal transporter [Psychroflexus planctonicus]GGE30100.1 manganese transporter [Psychroflexus planctonicus]